jgi:phosphatidylserine/phosphatidylglycerophosphate/cardiolipin synthase-like enzyme
VIAVDGDVVAYLGGIDIEAGRTNWTDCHCRLAGPAAFDVYSNFLERWMNVVGESGNEVKGQRDPGPSSMRQGLR